METTTCSCENDLCIRIGWVILSCMMSFLMGHWHEKNNGLRKRHYQHQEAFVSVIPKKSNQNSNHKTISKTNNNNNNNYNNSIASTFIGLSNDNNNSDATTVTFTNKMHDDYDDDDKSNNDNVDLKVLESVLIMIQEHWSNKHSSINNGANLNVDHADNNNNKAQPVVRYKTPKELWDTLFIKQQLSVSFPCLLDKNNYNTNNDNDDDNDQQQQLQLQQAVAVFTNMLQSIQQYSVNTNHKFFFNQLFGTLDPKSLAAELFITSCCHTSSYTYETAPVLTLLEQDILQEMRNLVYSGGHNNDDNSDDDASDNVKTAATIQTINVPGDGLFCPGGSLSNLLAMHAARQMFVKNCSSTLVKEDSDTEFQDDNDNNSNHEEKKSDMEELHSMTNHTSKVPQFQKRKRRRQRPVALVSAEAHYSFEKAANITGIELLTLPTTRNGQIDLKALEQILMDSNRDDNGTTTAATDSIPFFIGLTAGSTVRGSFDPIQHVVQICRRYQHQNNAIWIHVDGAWGGSAIFSKNTKTKKLFQGLDQVDSFTFNPHKMLGAPQQTTMFLTKHKGVLKMANATGATYLFDERKNGAAYDLGDSTFTCGRRPDAIKFWAMYKFYGRDGLATRVDDKVRILSTFAERIQKSDAFMLACDPWPFNVNFFYLPMRLRHILKERSVNTRDTTDPYLPDDVSLELAQVSVALKLRLHEAGEMILPYQPLTTQKADCFRLVLAGKKEFNESDIERMMDLMDQYGQDL